jgi:hypothetical protein
MDMWWIDLIRWYVEVIPAIYREFVEWREIRLILKRFNAGYNDTPAIQMDDSWYGHVK